MPRQPDDLSFEMSPEDFADFQKALEEQRRAGGSAVGGGIMAPRQPEAQPGAAPALPPPESPAPAAGPAAGSPESLPGGEGVTAPREPEPQPAGPTPPWMRQEPVHEARQLPGVGGQESAPAWSQAALGGPQEPLAPMQPSQTAPSLGSFRGLPSPTASAGGVGAALAGGTTGGNSRELIDALEDLTDEVKRLREAMEREGRDDEGPDARQEREKWVWQAGAVPAPRSGAAPSVPKVGGK